jgi:catechol 2,3-dioxygenase-like lactoylglutathione lyase family enzyme
VRTRRPGLFCQLLISKTHRENPAMKRFHVHLHVDDLAKSIAFYSRLFAAEPARVESDYAKWMLDDPAVNFAISTRGQAGGIDHLGFQTDSPEELAALKARAEAADMALLDEGATTCCYARSEKHWITDPQGIAWEHFHTLGTIPVFREGEGADTGACCTPAAPAAEPAAVASCAPRGKPIGIPVKSSTGSCC